VGADPAALSLARDLPSALGRTRLRSAWDASATPATIPRMSTVTFDTLKFVKELESAGIPPAQAEAFVRAQQEILAQALDSTLATRIDIERIGRKLIEHDGKFTLMPWMLGIVVGGVMVLVLKAFFPV
jgi:hypothetical protein